MNNNEEVIRIFLQPSRTGISLYLVLFLILICGVIIYYYRDINNNWDKYKCNPIILMTAGIFGKNTQDNLKDCLKHTQSEAVYNSVQTIQDEIKIMNNKIANLTGNNGVSVSISTANSEGSPSLENNPLNNLAVMIQQNIISVSNALSKLLGAFVLSTYMTQGAITTTQTLQNSKTAQALQNLMDIKPPAPQAPMSSVTSTVPNISNLF